MYVILRMMNKIKAIYIMKKIKIYQINGFQHIVFDHILQKQSLPEQKRTMEQ